MQSFLLLFSTRAWLQAMPRVTISSTMDFNVASIASSTSIVTKSLMISLRVAGPFSCRIDSPISLECVFPSCFQSLFVPGISVAFSLLNVYVVSPHQMPVPVQSSPWYFWSLRYSRSVSDVFISDFIVACDSAYSTIASPSCSPQSVSAHLSDSDHWPDYCFVYAPLQFRCHLSHFITHWHSSEYFA